MSSNLELDPSFGIPRRIVSLETQLRQNRLARLNAETRLRAVAVREEENRRVRRILRISASVVLIAVGVAAVELQAPVGIRFAVGLALFVTAAVFVYGLSRNR